MYERDDMKNTMNILILGHKGMLGNATLRYFSEKEGFGTLTTDRRYGEPDFEEFLKSVDADIIINAIGTIPQKKPQPEDYQKFNVELPRFLDTLGKKVIHPSTDCEFKGDIPEDRKYAKSSARDADDIYGKSKADASYEIENNFKNTKAIRTSIIGHELNSSLSLLDWFLAQEGQTRGYTNHLWNGITTLEWAKRAEHLINNWNDAPVLNQFGTAENLSKYAVLDIVKDVYGKDIAIIPFQTETSFNKCLESDEEIADLRQQLIELKTFYGK
jgi:dTDP-4-dehydrorhamnose reductase